MGVGPSPVLAACPTGQAAPSRCSDSARLGAAKLECRAPEAPCFTRALGSALSRRFRASEIA
eukprot:12131103-Alexandrium_andersonii.AAC.1